MRKRVRVEDGEHGSFVVPLGGGTRCLSVKWEDTLWENTVCTLWKNTLCKNQIPLWAAEQDAYPLNGTSVTIQSQTSEQNFTSKGQ